MVKKNKAAGIGYRPLIALGVLLVLVFGAYSNSFQSAWHLDDYPNVVNNFRLHLSNFSPDSLINTFFSRQGAFNNLYRPVACLTFALNWYFGNNNVGGYHFVNISIHFLTAFFLFLTIFNLYKSPGLRSINMPYGFWTALLSALIWALNPIQTQAVTYIVQRMASLAALFYIIGIYFYLKGRNSRIGRHQILFFAGCAVSFVMALGSKENAITLPLALLLTEIVFYQNFESGTTRRILRTGGVFSGTLLILIIAYLVFNASDLDILKGYQYRSFTLWQRLMTEPRIVVFYLTQLFYPMPYRLSIEHDINLSVSLFEPWATLPAILLVALLIVLGLSQIRKRPILAFGLLFFFINHLIESTILPLELVFEHRNYLPSLFLFFPVAAALFWLVDYYQQRSELIVKVLVSFMVLLVLGLGLSTYMRNMAWATEKSLWEDAMKKAPGRARPAYNLAKHYVRTGHLDAALALYQKALAQEASKPGYTQALTLNGIASIYYKKGDFERARKFCQRALEIQPKFETARYNLVLVLAKLKQWDRVAEQIDLLLVRRKNSNVYLFLKGEYLLKQNKPSEALSYFREALKIAPNDKKTLLNIGIALILMNQYRQAEWFLQRVKNISPNDIRPYVYLIEAGLKSENTARTERYLDDLVTRFTAKRLNFELQHCFNDIGLTPVSRKLICSAVNDKIIYLADDLARMGEF